MQQATNSVRHRSAMQEHSIWSQVKFGIYWVQGYCALTFINLLPCLTSVFKFYLNYWVGVKERSGAQHSHKRPFPSCCYLCFKTGVGTQVSFHVEMRLHCTFIVWQIKFISIWNVVHQEEKATQKWLLENFLFFLLQTATRATRRLGSPNVQLTVVKATCVTRFQSQWQNLKIDQQVKPLNWLQALEPFCLFLRWICLPNPISTNVFYFSLDVSVYLYKKSQFKFC